MNNFKICPKAIARAIALSGILLLCVAFFSSNAFGCPNANAPTAAAQTENSDALSEEFSFLIENFKMNHQAHINTLINPSCQLLNKSLINLKGE